MNLQFLGAAREVTGSCYLLEANGLNILVDCGMEQGQDIYENQQIPVSAGIIDAVLLTHAHIDHSGNLPFLVAQGFKGPIFATTATCQLCDIMLRDSAHIQEFEAEWRNRKAMRSGDSEYSPAYTMEDAMAAIKLFKPLKYNEFHEIAKGIRAKYVDVGHLLGSASILVEVNENNNIKTICFSGDIGNQDQPILKNPKYITKADFVVMESTYGDRSHGERPDYIADLSAILQKTLDKGGNLVIPSFAVGRTQELLYFFREIIEKKLIKNHGDFIVYVDSPLAVEATNIFKNSDISYFDKETQKLILDGINPISFPNLRTSITSDDSKAINFDTTPKVIISASGMCSAGRIRHHLKHNLWRKESTILFVGYQAVGTLGREILDSAKNVKLFGEDIEIKANIQTLNAISGHADNNGLIKWAEQFNPKPERYFVCHGEEEVAELFANRLTNELGLVTSVPYNGEKWDLINNKMLVEGNKTKIVKKETQSYGEQKYNPIYVELLNMEKRLHNIIKNSSGFANSLLKKLTKQIEKICEFWENN